MIYGVEASEVDTAVAPPLYTASAVHFAGSIDALGPTFLNIASLTAGADNGNFAFSFWATNLISGGNENTTVWVTDPTSTFAPVVEIGGGGSANEVQWQFWDGPGEIHGFSKHWRNSIPDPPDFNVGQWNHYLGSSESNLSGAGAKLMCLYLNDVPVAPDFTGSDSTAFINPVNAKRFMFGDDTFGDGPTFDCADVWIAPNIKLHDGTGAIPTATRRQFIDGSGRPVDPTTWPTSAIQFYGDHTAFPTNHGTGGSFTLTGVLTDAATHP